MTALREGRLRSGSGSVPCWQKSFRSGCRGLPDEDPGVDSDKALALIATKREINVTAGLERLLETLE